MAVVVDKNIPQNKKSITQLRAENTALMEENLRLKSMVYCRMCGKPKRKAEFHVSTDPMIKGEIAGICKDCAKKIALRVDANGDEHEPTRESVQTALRYLDKPFLESVWDASIQESTNLTLGKTKTNVWTSYVKNIAMGQYNTLTWKDSDIFKNKIKYEDEKTEKEVVEEHSGMDTYDSFLKNKSDVIRLLDYDPFEKEAVSDQPFLYSQLLGLLDSSEDANEDMMRTASAISIVRGFLQQAKIDDTIAKLMINIGELENNASTIKSLQDSKGKITSIIKDLAAESCLSLKNSKTSIKGENTWTGKIKKIKDLNLREGQVNGFDIATCRGMAQVQEISDASIMKQLALDESEWSDMVAELRSKRVTLERELAQYKEINRILLQENIDLKDYFEEKGIPINNCKNLKDLYSVFAKKEEEGETDDSSE